MVSSGSQGNARSGVRQFLFAAPEPDSLADVPLAYGPGAVQIGDRAGYAENVMISARTQMQRVKRVLQQLFSGGIPAAETFQISCGKLAVEMYAGIPVALLLYPEDPDDLFPHFGRRTRGTLLPGQIPIAGCRHFASQINAVQQGLADPGYA